MSLAEQMIRSLQFEDSYLEAAQQKSEEHIVVDESRRINIPASLKTIAVTGDCRVESVTFDCVRYWDEHDLSTFSIFINYILPNNKVSTYIPKSVWLDENDESVFHFEWEIWPVMTQYQGNITFGITAIQGGNPGRQWSSLPSKDFVVAQGVEVSFAPEDEIEASTILQQMSEILAEMQSTALIGRVVQITGTSETDVMSQKGVTDALENYKTNLLEAIATAKSESISASKQYTDTKKAELDGNIAQNTQKISENATSIGENAKKIAQNSSEISRNSKRLTNIERGLPADVFYEDNSVAFVKDVPLNALPYAEINKIWGGTSHLYCERRVKVFEDMKTANLTLDTSWLPSDITVEKLADGSVKINGFTQFQGSNACKFATIPLAMYAFYRMCYEVVSQGNAHDFFFTAKNNINTSYNLSESATTVDCANGDSIDLYVDIGTGESGVVDLIVKFKVGKAEPYYQGIRVDEFRIPEEVTALDGYEDPNNYIDFDKGVFVRKDTSEEINIREYIGYDNFIEVSRDETDVYSEVRGVSSIDGTGKFEITFMLKGV